MASAEPVSAYRPPTLGERSSRRSPLVGSCSAAAPEIGQIVGVGWIVEVIAFSLKGKNIAKLFR
jgi:hypothetical protein